MTVWFWGTQSWFHPCLQYTQFLPNLTACLCRRPMSKSGATWKTALLAPCLVCSKPRKLPSALLILCLRIGIARSFTERRLSRNCRGLARRLGRLLRLVARSNFRIFLLSMLYLFSNNEYATRLQKVTGFIGLFYLSVYKLTFCYINAENVWMSVPKPPRPIIRLSWYLNTRWKSFVIVRSCLPNLRSQAIPTQSFPTIPTNVPPLYSWMDILDFKIFSNLIIWLLAIGY